MPDSSAHPSIAPAQGWWAVYRRDDHTTYRVRVAVWATEHINTESDDYMAVRALILSDGDDLIPANAMGDLAYLWHDGQSWCGCRDQPFDAWTTDDIYWCPNCAGVIGS